MGGGIRVIPGVQALGFEFHGRDGLAGTIGVPHASKIKPGTGKFPGVSKNSTRIPKSKA
jgi:hypothetical protein